jgi:selenocysteine lyase/cysteine desulfurase
VALGVDLLLWSPYKVYGPHLGVLSAAPELLAALQPEKVRPSPDEGPDRWQTGTAPFELAAGLDAVLGLIEGAGGIPALAAHEAALSGRFLTGLRALDAGLTLHGPATTAARTPTFALTSPTTAPQVLAQRLAERGIDATAGHVYAVEPCRALGLDEGVLRIGFAAYHDERDIDRVLEALDTVAAPGTTQAGATQA